MKNNKRIPYSDTCLNFATNAGDRVLTRKMAQEEREKQIFKTRMTRSKTQNMANQYFMVFQSDRHRKQVHRQPKILGKRQTQYRPTTQIYQKQCLNITQIQAPLHMQSPIQHSQQLHAYTREDKIQQQYTSIFIDEVDVYTDQWKDNLKEMKFNGRWDEFDVGIYLNLDR